MSEETFTLPVGPAELCFETKEFMKGSFSVDEFLHTHRNAGTLEQMRDDLGLYLKVLRSAMIELINKDYQDFVNLSAELVNLDEAIETIRKPVLQLREEIVQVRDTLTDSVDEITSCIAAKKEILAAEKQKLETTKSTEAILRVRELLREEEPDLFLMERMTRNVVEVQHVIRSFGVEGQIKQDAEYVHELLLEVLNCNFLKWYLGDQVKLEKCLKIYVMLDQCHEAEKVFREKVVIPAMKPVISDSSLQNSPRGVVGIYDQTVDFIHKNMPDLLFVCRKVKGFDFLLNSFWSEVEQRIEINMSSIFAPGNPDLFHQKFLSTLEFLSKIEAFSDAKFRQHPQYKSFFNKWNLPVYFQIRFQEIAANLEAVCSKDISKDLLTDNELKLTPFSTTLACISKSWSEGVFLAQLYGRFLKLTLQFLSRLGTWIDHAVEVALDDPELPKASFLMILYIDIVHFELNFPNIIEKVLSQKPPNLSNQEEAIRSCFQEAKNNLSSRLSGIESKIAFDLIANSSPYIKQVNDIPRLYRKTNRDVPTKNCAYVDHTLAPSKTFHEKHLRDIGEEKCSQFLQKVFEALTDQYFVAVNDVLTSVQKTEESLRRLKNLRGAATSEQRQGMSDDDKIRLQLQVDAMHWVKVIEDFGIKMPKLQELLKLVEEATKIVVE